MLDPWPILEACGLPVGAPRPPPARLDRSAVRSAVRALLGADVAGDRRDALAAWLAAWRRHWPGSFAEVLGPEGDLLLARVERQGVDADRYLKLRRIAIENLASVV